jgi:4-amino-4-deoxy-L-arabinose transferase-like glycosyltransferase
MLRLKPKELQKYQTLIIWTLVVIFAAFVCFYKLGSHFFSDWDEAWYAVMTKEMLKTHQLIIPTWNYSFLFDKPPFYIWLSSISSVIFGLSEFAVRLPSAISGFAVLLLVFWYSFKKWGTVPAVIAFLSLALNDIYIWRTRGGNLDATSTLFIFITFLLILSKHKYKYLLIGLMFGLTYLTKASLVAYPVAVFALYEFVYERKKWKIHLVDYLKLIGVTVLIVGSWLLAGYLIAGKGFLEYFLFKSDQGNASISFHNFRLDYLRFTYHSLQGFFFLFLLGIGALLVPSRKRRRERFLTLAFALSLLIELTFSSQGNNWYLMPAMPFWALSIGYGIFWLSELSYFKNKYLLFVPLYLVVMIFSFHAFIVNIKPIIKNPTHMGEVRTARKIKELSKPGEKVVRLDVLFPSATYYSDRPVFASPENAVTGDQFISREDLYKEVKEGKIVWIFGKTDDITSLINKHIIDGDITLVTRTEAIFKAHK